MRVLFVSKPIVPPFHDGTKCLVRDIALNLTRVQPVWLSAREGASAAAYPGVEAAAVYSSPGSFTPAFAQSLRAAAWLLFRSRADVWHFVYAPNPRTSKAGAWLKRARRVPVVQTIASPPRSFASIDQLLFGDVVVAQSRWTRESVLAAYGETGTSPPRLCTIPPPVPEDITRSEAQIARTRAELGIPANVPLFVYPGDLETSSGAAFTAELCATIRQRVPNAMVVFAYRRKSAAADPVAARLRAELDPAYVRVVPTLPDVLSLIAGATAVLFPVDDLWGKVDLPIVLLEAMVLGVPVVALGAGPLTDLDAACLLPALETELWLRELARLANDPGARHTCIERQRAAVLERHSPRVIARAYEELYLELHARHVRGR